MVSSSTKLKVVILGSSKCGKSAVTVRYLTKRYIEEYSSNSDFMYRHTTTIDMMPIEVEILDTSNCQVSGCLYDHIQWADAFVVVYDICNRQSFEDACKTLETISQMKQSYRKFASSTILLGNKRDLEHARKVGVDDGHEMSLRYSSQFYEVSAADSYVGVSLAFQSLFREAFHCHHVAETLPSARRKSSAAVTVSKMIGMVFGKTGTKTRNGKKRPSLSI